MKLGKLVLAAMLVIGATAPAVADREPSVEERAGIEAALRAHGFATWEDIELDDGWWRVDDAVTVDGREYDLTLDPWTLAIVEGRR
jgi:hypothetical protein